MASSRKTRTRHGSRHGNEAPFLPPDCKQNTQSIPSMPISLLYTRLQNLFKVSQSHSCFPQSRRGKVRYGSTSLTSRTAACAPIYSTKVQSPGSIIPGTGECMIGGQDHEENQGSEQSKNTTARKPNGCCSSSPLPFVLHLDQNRLHGIMVQPTRHHLRK